MSPKIDDMTADRKASQDKKITGGLAGLKQDINAINTVQDAKSVLKRLYKLIVNEDA